MSTSIDTSGAAAPGTGLESLSAAGKARFGAFTLVALGALVVAGAMMRGELAMVYTGWFQDFGVHQVHDQLLFTFLWIALVVPFALLLYHPTGRVNTVLAPVLFAAPWVVMAVVVDSPILMLGVIFGVLGVLALALHPAGRSVLAFDRIESVDRNLAGLFAVGAVPLAAYGGIELYKQFTITDDHALFVHFGSMALAAFFVVVMGGLAVLRERDWRFAAWSAGLTAAVLGVVSVAYPAIESSLGLVGGGLLVLWAVAFVAAVEYVRRRRRGDEVAAIDGVGAGSA